MAELCRKCFIEICNANAYDLEHIVMSNESDFCEKCTDFMPYVDYIDLSDLRVTSTSNDFVRVVDQEASVGHNVACIDCGAVFDDDDLAYTNETGLCQHCYSQVNAIWVKQ